MPSKSWARPPLVCTVSGSTLTQWVPGIAAPAGRPVVSKLRPEASVSVTLFQRTAKLKIQPARFEL